VSNNEFGVPVDELRDMDQSMRVDDAVLSDDTETAANQSDGGVQQSIAAKRKAYLVSAVGLIVALATGLPAGIFGSIPMSGFGNVYLGRPFFGTLIGVGVGLVIFVAAINLIGHLLGVRREVIAIIVTPPARFRTRSGKANKTLLITTMATMLAIGVVLNILSFSFPGFGGRASFVYMFMYLSGILFGPIFGFVVSFLADGIGHMLSPQGIYSPFIGMGNGLTATIVALIFKLRFSNKAYKDMLLGLFVFVCIATIMSTYYFGPFYEGGTPITNSYGVVTGYTSGRGLHNGARVIIIAIVAALLVIGLYKIINIKTHTDTGQERSQWFVKLLLGAIIAFVPATLLLGSYGIYVLGLMPGAFNVIMLARLISQPVWVGINLFVLYLLIPPLNRTVFRHHPIT